MKNIFVFTILTFISGLSCSQNYSTEEKNMENYRPLSAEEKRVIVHKGTEVPFTGYFNDFYEKGVYTCKRCGAALYESDSKFKSGCGWPSFDDEIEGAVKRLTDADGRRTEILCDNCGAHLGHVFMGEGFTPKNTRHCVNSISLDFVPMETQRAETDTAIFAGGCFWGVEYYMQQADGVLETDVGYIGDYSEKPTYEEVCSHTTNFAEAVRIVFDPVKTDYETLAKLFFEIHDPTQVDRQGPDMGRQYRSEIFYNSWKQKQTSEKLIGQLEDKGYKVATQLSHAGKFWPAEDYHQDYYAHKGSLPYCHAYKKRF